MAGGLKMSFQGVLEGVLAVCIIASSVILSCLGVGERRYG